jgi:hypothetical protein
MGEVMWPGDNGGACFFGGCQWAMDFNLKGSGCEF